MIFNLLFQFCELLSFRPSSKFLYCISTHWPVVSSFLVQKIFYCDGMSGNHVPSYFEWILSGNLYIDCGLRSVSCLFRPSKKAYPFSECILFFRIAGNMRSLLSQSPSGCWLYSVFLFHAIILFNRCRFFFYRSRFYLIHFCDYW